MLAVVVAERTAALRTTSHCVLEEKPKIRWWLKWHLVSEAAYIWCSGALANVIFLLTMDVIERHLFHVQMYWNISLITLNSLNKVEPTIWPYLDTLNSDLYDIERTWKTTLFRVRFLAEMPRFLENLEAWISPRIQRWLGRRHEVWEKWCDLTFRQSCFWNVSVILYALVFIIGSITVESDLRLSALDYLWHGTWHRRQILDKTLVRFSACLLVLYHLLTF